MRLLYLHLPWLNFLKRRYATDPFQKAYLNKDLFKWKEPFLQILRYTLALHFKMITCGALKRKLTMQVHLLMYWNAIAYAHLFNMFRQAEHLYFVIYTLRPRYVSCTVMPEITWHTWYVIKLFFPHCVYIAELYIVLIKEAKFVPILISNIALFIFQHNCLFNCTSFPPSLNRS